MRRAAAVTCLLVIVACGASVGCERQEPERQFPEPPSGSYDAVTFQVQVQRESDSVEGARITPEFIRTTAVRPLLGRSFVDGDYIAGAGRVVLISNDWWTTRFERSPQLIGTAILVEGQPAVVVGVLEPSFHIPKQAKLWVPKKQ
jgi:hypothetical protein